jgi:CTP-dependent riboflavin kinase
MTIDEAIAFCNEKSKNIKLKTEPQTFIDIAEWLEELKAIKSDGFTDNLLNMGYTKGYRKAIDDMANNLIRNSRTEFIDREICLIVTDKRIRQIAELMKGV